MGIKEERVGPQLDGETNWKEEWEKTGGQWLKIEKFGLTLGRPMPEDGMRCPDFVQLNIHVKMYLLDISNDKYMYGNNRL